MTVSRENSKLVYQGIKDAGIRFITALPETWQAISESLEPRQRARLAPHYLAGQTDRYAIAEHRRLFAETPELR
mgnify:CR=1 FL=1